MYLFETGAGNQTFCSASVFITPARGSSRIVARFNLRRNNISVIIIHLNPEVCAQLGTLGLSIESGMERSGIPVLRENAIFEIFDRKRLAAYCPFTYLVVLRKMLFFRWRGTTQGRQKPKRIT